MSVQVTNDANGIVSRSDEHARRRWLMLVHVFWFVCAALALLILLAGIPLGYARLLSGAGFHVPIDAPAWYIASVSIAQGIVSLAAALVSLVLAGIVFWKKRNDPLALLVSFYLLAYGIILAGPLEALDGFPPLFPGASAPSGALISINIVLALQASVFIPALLLFFLFPTGHFVPVWTRYATWLLLVIAPLFVYVTINEWLPTTTPLAWFTFAMILMLVGAGVYSQVYRYRRVASSIERQKTKWVVFGLVLTFFFMGVSQIPYAVVSQIPVGESQPWWVPLSGLIWWITISILPFSLAIAVLGYRLWEIDLVINRALVYGTLTVLVIALYVLIVGGFSMLFQLNGNLLVSLLATGIVAVLFQPLRERVQRAVNRLTYGERDEPYVVLARLGQRLESTLAPQAVLPMIVETVAQALQVPYVAIALSHQAQEQKTEWGQLRPASSAPFTFPLLYQNETLGNLIVAPRTGEEKFSTADRRLLDDLARQAGVAAHSVQLTTDLQRLTAELQRSRERLVAAREEERRRLRRDLHDGLGPTLAALALNASTMRDLIDSDSDSAMQMASELQIEIRAAVTEIRRLVYALRPPTLDELGLVGAIRELANQSMGHLRRSNPETRLSITVDAPDTLPPLPAAVEVAAYRIAQEALTNIVRHAHARNCSIRLAPDGTEGSQLQIEICDDGIGLPEERRAGVGLNSMRERAEELGGTFVIESQSGKSTRVIAHLPIAHAE